MIEIFGLPIAVHVRKAIVVALYKDIAFENVPVFPFDPPPGWRELSPTGLIPAMREGDFTLADSTAIAHYLDVSRPGPRIVPEEPRTMARAMFIDAYAGQTLFRNAIQGLFFQHKLSPMLFGKPTDQAVVDAILAGPLPEFLTFLDSAVDGSHFAGNSHTIGDIAVASNLVNYCYLGYRLDRSTYPALAAFLDSMIGWPPFAEALAQEAKYAREMMLDREFLTSG
ncbi:glutathione S-transferase family protein [Novosphingobium sp. JCM 18896]|uniref:glutathione S-transferase family protein n=1 Tax=Novosphingobium sp. JCM 18896 TaxID=2989731 RepID=UPI00222234CF|nr:glutathione S-transferase family protein [Novosphingobium sp. JCM 18896]MCW1427825.1 glutathione S-transferase family protein [Novosphingobium sp. JCM 18896]